MHHALQVFADDLATMSRVLTSTGRILAGVTVGQAAKLLAVAAKQMADDGPPPSVCEFAPEIAACCSCIVSGRRAALVEAAKAEAAA